MKYVSKTWEEYQQYMKDKKDRWTFDELDSEIPQDLKQEDYEQLWIDLTSPTAYFANFPILKSTTLNQSDPDNENYFKQTIVDINVFDWSWRQ